MLLCWEPAGVGVWLLGGWVSAASSDGVTVEPSGGAAHRLLGGGRPLLSCMHPGRAKCPHLRVACSVVCP